MGKDIELAILFADVVGSTRLYESLGDLRARDMIALCIDVMRTATEQHQGTVIKTMGDEVMSTFPILSYMIDTFPPRPPLPPLPPRPPLPPFPAVQVQVAFPPFPANESIEIIYQ